MSYRHIAISKGDCLGQGLQRVVEGDDRSLQHIFTSILVHRLSHQKSEFVSTFFSPMCLCSISIPCPHDFLSCYREHQHGLVWKQATPKSVNHQLPCKIAITGGNQLINPQFSGPHPIFTSCGRSSRTGARRTARWVSSGTSRDRRSCAPANLRTWPKGLVGHNHVKYISPVVLMAQ